MRALSRARRRSVVAVLVLVGLLAVGAWRLQSVEADVPGWPDAPADRREASATVPDPGQGTTSFLARTEGDDPVTYDPCVPIHVVVNLRTAPPVADQLLVEAVAAVTAASGLEFVIDGTTDEAPAEDRALQVGGAWAPVLVAWSDPEESPGLDGDIVGRGGSARATRDGREWWVTGTVQLDGPALTQMLGQAGGYEMARSVVMHELGHLLGLDHVDDTNELMHPQGDRPDRWWGPGDRSGLARLGAGPCVDY